MPEADNKFDPDAYGSHLSMAITPPWRDKEHPQFARMTKRSKNKDGKPIGVASDKAWLDTWMCEVEFADGHKQAM